MKLHRLQIALVVLSAAFALAPAAQAVIIATSKGLGADAEVRDHQPTTNFGASTELAARIVDNLPFGHANDGNDRFSAMYLKFDITGQNALPNQATAVRLTYRNTNFTPNRIHDTTPPGNNMDFRTGIAFYGLDRDNSGNSWSEATITYLTAPGMAGGGDFNNGTKDLDFVDPDGAGPLRAPLTPLGVALFPEVPPQNRLPVGGELIFSSVALNSFVTLSLNASKPTVTIVACLVHDGKIPINDWKNFNYLFNPKEQVTLTTDTGYDADTTDPNNPLGSPWSAASNAEDANGFSPFSPQLIFASLPGDFNADWSVDAADYVVWRKTDGTQTGYQTWRAHFGETFGGGANASATVPEPATIAMLVVAVASVSTRRRRAASEVPKTHQRVRFVNNPPI